MYVRISCIMTLYVHILTQVQVWVHPEVPTAGEGARGQGVARVHGTRRAGPAQNGKRTKIRMITVIMLLQRWKYGFEIAWALKSCLHYTFKPVPKPLEVEPTRIRWIEPSQLQSRSVVFTHQFQAAWEPA